MDFGSLLVTVPHCSGHVSFDVLDSMLGGRAHEPDERMRLELELRAKADPHTDELYFFPSAHHCYALTSRFVVDLNRERSDIAENGAIKFTDFDGNSLYPVGFSLSDREYERRLHQYWDPFHRMVAETWSSPILMDSLEFST